jgi:uncharacterized membrane protein YdjX (TVP38/TMEM64 family)
MERLFQLLAIVLAAAAGVLFWLGNTDGLFIAAVLGSVCFFLSIRFQVKERNDRRTTEMDENS